MFERTEGHEHGVRMEGEAVVFGSREAEAEEQGLVAAVWCHEPLGVELMHEKGEALVAVGSVICVAVEWTAESVKTLEAVVAAGIVDFGESAASGSEAEFVAAAAALFVEQVYMETDKSMLDHFEVALEVTVYHSDLVAIQRWEDSRVLVEEVACQDAYHTQDDQGAVEGYDRWEVEAYLDKDTDVDTYEEDLVDNILAGASEAELVSSSSPFQ